MKRLRLGIGATDLEFGDGFRKAGVGRYAIRTMETLLAHPGDFDLVVFHRPETTVPEAWRAVPHAEFHPTWRRTRTYNLVGREVEAIRHRLDAWWSLGGPVPRLPFGTRLATVHDIFFLTEAWTYDDRERAIQRERAEAIVRHADLISSSSEHTRGDLVRHMGRTPESVFVSPLGLGNLGVPVAREDVDRALLREIGVPFERYVFSLSTLEPRKNFGRLLQAWAIAGTEPDLRDVGLVVGGGKGWETSDLDAEIDRLGLRGRVHFAGYVPDAVVPHLFGGCETFVLPSLVEGFGITVLEAMHYGAPVACAATGSLPEVAGDLGVTFDPYDPAAMARAILTLVRDVPERRADRVRRGFARAAEFSWERHVATVLDRIAAYRR